jgi:hypothetical protein
MTNFSWLNKQGVESDSGFIVQRTGRFTEEYREGGRIIVIDVEGSFMGDKHVTNYSRASFAAWSKDPVEQQRVIDNYRSALIFQGSLPVEY